MKKIFLASITIFSFCSAIIAQKIVRLDNSYISAAALTQKIKSLMDTANVQGLAIAIFNDRKPVYQKTFGYKRIDTKERLQNNTVFYGASLSKAVFAVLVMKLVDEKIISLDTPLQNYLPKPVYEYGEGKSWNEDFTALKLDTLYKKITARMCLSHTAGFPNWRWDEPDQKLRVNLQPGSRYSYSGEGFCYLQFVIEKMSGKSLEELMNEKLFGPLHMTSSAYSWKQRFENNYCFGHGETDKIFPKDKDNAPRSASTLETTLDDYSRFIAAVLQKKLLSPGAYQEMFSAQTRLRSKKQMGPLSRQDTTANDHIELSYGLAWGLLKTPYGFGAFKEGHHDEGWQHYSIIFPEKNSGIIIMSNSNNAEKIFKELLEVAIGDVYTPWEWQQYIPYNYPVKK